MPKTRTRKTAKANWNQETIEKSLKLIEEGESIRSAAKKMGLPFSTLQERLKKKNFNTPSLGRNRVFTHDQEKEMADHIKYMASIFYGCTTTEVRKIAYQYAEANGIKHNFSQDTKMAGRDWLKGFQKRQKISARKAEGISLNRVTAFNEEEVNLFFANLEEVMGKYKFLPKNIYNCDETGISTVQDPGKVMAETGQKRVGSITSGERGCNITVMCAMNAAGGYIPPMFIFPRQRLTPLLEKDGPPGALYKCTKNGWSNEAVFPEWLEHFAKNAKPSAAEPVLLILDNHTSHVSLAAYEYCKKNNIVMLSLPPHSSHRMQPLDVALFSPLKLAYVQECNMHMKSHLADKITVYDIASLFHKAYSRVASMNKAQSGFRVTGIFPLNPSVFTEQDFLAAQTLEDPASIPTVVVHQSLLQNSVADRANPVTPTSTDDPVPSTSSVDPVPSTSFAYLTPTAEPSSFRNTSIQELLPVPSHSRSSKPKRQGRSKQHSTVLTSTPLKDSLIEKENKKIQKSLKGKGTGKKTKKTDTKHGPKSQYKRKVLQESNSTSESELEMANLCDDDEDDDMENPGNRCIICDEFGRDNELWYRCTLCGFWAHEECSGWDTPDGYICENCLEFR